MSKPPPEKSYHRWTPDEDKALLQAVKDLEPQFKTIGTPGGVARDLFWGQIPGRIGVMVTGVACSMRYRTLAGTTKWSQERRARSTGGASPASEASPETFAALTSAVEEIRALLAQLVEIAQRAPR